MRARIYAGSYLSVRLPYTTWEKPVRALAGFRVEPTAPGEIVIHSPSWAIREFEMEQGYFRSGDGTFAASFRERPGGATHLSLSVMAGMPLEKQPFAADLRLHGIMLLGSLLMLGSGLVFSPVRFALQRRGCGVEPLRGWERGLRWAAITLSLLAIGFVIAAAASLGGEDRFVTGEAANSLRASLLLPILAIPVAAVVAGGTVLAVRRGYWSRSGRIHYALVAVAAIVFLLQLQYWNLLGWRF